MAKRRITCNDSPSNPSKKTFSIFKSPMPNKISAAQHSTVDIMTVDPSMQTPPAPSTNPVPQLRTPSTAPAPTVTQIEITPVSLPPETVINDAGSATKNKYKGVGMDMASVAKWAGPGVLSQYSALQGKRNRAFVRCNTCAAHEEEAKRYSPNGFVYMAHGVRYDSEKKLTDVIDHILSPMHKAADEAKRHKQQWSIQSEDHPWLKALKKHEMSVVSSLIRLAIDVYNDSKLLTPTAWPWPSRSLASLHAEAQVNLLKQYGMEYNFSTFDPSGSELHYRDPMVYAEMLSTISDVVGAQLKDEIAGAVTFSAQIDGSVDLKQHDNKFVFVRYNKADDPLQIETCFAAVASSEIRGSEGLLDALLSTFNTLNLSTAVLDEKFVGVTTDGESANTGRHSGLWKRLEDHLHRPLMNFWCACHRSDLATEDLESAVPELRTWKLNLVSLATHYRTSGCRTKELAAVSPDVVSFPSYTEIRFAQHLVTLSNAVLHNLKYCHTHWEQVVARKSSEKREKQTATGFAKTWATSGQQAFITSVMSDVCVVFQSLEKALQRVDIVLPDVLKHRDIAVSKLNTMLVRPFPGGKEEAFEAARAEDDEASTEPPTSHRAAKVTQKYVSGFNRNRSYSAIRLEIIQSSINFISERLDDDQQVLVKSIIDVSGAKDPTQFIDSSRPLLECAGIPKSKVQQFASEVFDIFDNIKPSSNIPENDYTVRIMFMLRHSTGLVQKLLSALVVIAPHSMTVERCVSTYNMLFTKLRCTTSQATVNQRLMISWNGVPTAQFDPRPSVAQFLRQKDRRNSKPTPDIYKNRDFIHKFFN